MTYEINIQKRIFNEEKTTYKNCNIISNKEGTITKIISDKGIESVEINDHVKPGDILIDGTIKLNDEIKNTVCSSGKVYAKTWYTINIKTTKYYENIEYTGKKRYNIIINRNKIFKDKFLNYKIDDKKIKLFSNKYLIIKEKEIKREYLKYDEETLANNINNLVKEKLDVEIKDDYNILEQKLLKKIDNNSTIEIEYFIVVEQEISKLQVIE